ncbi:MAG TPA: helix-turn-helix transcriptional regulator [Afifellaceae bacterium]|nr:helix-turn-helix transcriptional regulator [Afifellaceae bacterium]
MNVRTLCLAILYFGDATGYEIKKLSMEGKYSHFVDASFGSIYPSLARLETDGLVTCREEANPGKPPRKVYSITEAGRAEFVRSLYDPPARDVFRSEFLLIAMCADILPPAVVRRAVETRIAQLNAEMEHLNQIAAESSHAGTLWAVDYGLCCIGGSLEYLMNRRAELEALAGTAKAEPTPVAAE